MGQNNVVTAGGREHGANDYAGKWCMDCIVSNDVQLQPRGGGSLRCDRVYVVPDGVQLAECLDDDGNVLFQDQDALVAGGIQNLVGVEMQQPSQATMGRQRSEYCEIRGGVELRTRYRTLNGSVAGRKKCGWHVTLAVFKPCLKTLPDLCSCHPENGPAMFSQKDVSLCIEVVLTRFIVLRAVHFKDPSRASCLECEVNATLCQFVIGAVHEVTDENLAMESSAQPVPESRSELRQKAVLFLTDKFSEFGGQRARCEDPADVASERKVKKFLGCGDQVRRRAGNLKGGQPATDIRAFGRCLHAEERQTRTV